MQPPDSPAWLVAYHAARGSSVPTPTPPKPVKPKPAPPALAPRPVVIKAPPPPPKPRGPRHVQSYRADTMLGMAYPDRWEYDGCVRREPVRDLDLHRIVRKVGWHHCLKCRKPFFSEDVVRQRMCDPCKEDESRFT